MDIVASKVRDGSVAAQSSIVVQGMAHLPGWGEKNFQVMAKQFEVIRVVATDSQTFTKRDGFVAIGGLVEKVGAYLGPQWSVMSISLLHAASFQ